MAIDEQRLLAWEGCYNARDLGGYATEDGRETRWKRIIRSDNLVRLTDVGRAALLDFGVRTIVDLRLPDELRIDPPPFRSHPDVTYHNISFIDPASVGVDSRSETLAEEYLRMLERFHEGMATAMSTVAQARPGAVLIHCHSGKDRTGIISALLLRLAGVPVSVAAEDYGLTSDCLRPLDEEWLESGPGDRADRVREYERWHARAEVMLEVLERLEQRHDTVERYLLDVGVPADDVRRLQDRLLD